jgi:ankyrin repeat protein
LLREPKNRQIVQKVRDDTCSLRASSTRGSHTQPPSLLSRNSTFIGTEFDMDNEIVNTDVYQRAGTHMRARSADERIRRPMGNASLYSPEGTNRFPSPDSGYGEASELSDRLSPIDIRSNRSQRPYVPSVASDPVDVHRRKPYVNITSASDSFLPGLNLSLENRAPKKKRSFLPSLFTGSSTGLLSPTAQNPFRVNSNRRRGRRHSDTDIHRSIDFDTRDGSTAPPLVRAAQSGSGIEIEELLDQRVDIESRHDRTNRTALAVASHCGNDDVVAILLQHRANPNAVDITGMTPLHLAATRGHYRAVELLLDEDVQVDAVGPQKKTALRLAADNGHLEVVNLLLNRRAKVNARDAYNLTALHSAAGLGDEDIVNLLLGYKADIEAKDGKFQSAIHHASEKGHEKIVDILLARKADIEAPGRESMSPLTTACASGSTDVVQLLLHRKASVKHKADGAMTPLHWASYCGHSDVVELLLEKKAPRDPQTNDGRTPLHLAVLGENFATAELLLRKGASVEASCQSGLRPLHYATQCTNIDLAQLLLGYNATIEAETRIGTRPLHYAASQGNGDMVDLLLLKGAVIDARDGGGDRPLCIASVQGNVQIVRLLLDRGAGMRTRYSTGPSHEDSPLCIAAKYGHLAVVEEFIRRGASARQRDETNWQPLRYAAYYGHPAVVQFLLSNGASISSLDKPGSFGFNLTAERIGFAQGAEIDEFQRQSVLTLLRDAEVREQESLIGAAHSHSTYGTPQQDFVAEKADDHDNGYGSIERQELPVLQKSPRERHPPYHTPYEAEADLGHKRDEYPNKQEAQAYPPRPRSPPTSQASRLTLDPSSSSQPQWRPVAPPIPAVPTLRAEYVAPTSSYQNNEDVRLQVSSQTSSIIPQSPSRPPPPPPQIYIPSVNNHVGNANHLPQSPPAPTRSAPLIPDLPPVPDPNDAIVVCEDCTGVGKNRTDLGCADCRRALYMYHHIMHGTPLPVISATNSSLDNFVQPIYEMA